MDFHPTKPTLLQFPISHFCEKTRWNLDWKGIPYRTVDVPPVVNRALGKRLGVRGTVPILFIDGKVLGDSAEIATFLDAKFPARPLIPAAVALADEARGIEAWFGKHVGLAMIRWMYGTLMTDEPGAAARTLFSYYGPPLSWLGQSAALRLEPRMRKAFSIDEATISASRDIILESLTRIETRLSEGGGRFLVGTELSIADITAASLLAPLIAPAGTPWNRPVPGPIDQFRLLARKRASGEWVQELYACSRVSGR